MKLSPSLTAVIALGALSLGAHASDYPEAFSLRFSSALSHYDVYGDTAAKGGASVSGKWGSSTSPAPMAWSFPKSGNEYIISGQFGNVAFDNGTHLNIISEAVSLNAGDFGVFRLDLGQVVSNTDFIRNAPLAYDFDAQLVRLEWAKRLSDEFAIGVKAGFLRSDTGFSTHGLDYSRSKSDSWSLGVGTLWEFAPKWFLGSFTDYGYGTGDTTSLVPTATGLSRGTAGSTDYHITFHPGISYEFKPGALVHAEYQFGWFNNDDGTLHQNRFMVGTDIPLAEFFYLRAGSSIDARGNVSWTTGIGFYPSRHLTFDLAFQSDAFPELSQEFGRSRTLNASVSIQW